MTKTYSAYPLRASTIKSTGALFTFEISYQDDTESLNQSICNIRFPFPKRHCAVNTPEIKVLRPHSKELPSSFAQMKHQTWKFTFSSCKLYSVSSKIKTWLPLDSLMLNVRQWKLRDGLTTLLFSAAMLKSKYRDSLTRSSSSAAIWQTMVELELFRTIFSNSGNMLLTRSFCSSIRRRWAFIIFHKLPLS